MWVLSLMISSFFQVKKNSNPASTIWTTLKYWRGMYETYNEEEAELLLDQLLSRLHLDGLNNTNTLSWGEE